jgi:hypothetical protein
VACADIAQTGNNRMMPNMRASLMGGFSPRCEERTRLSALYRQLKLPPRELTHSLAAASALP